MFHKTCAALVMMLVPVVCIAQPLSPKFDAASFTFSQTNAMDFDGGAGELEVTRFELGTFLMKPVTSFEGLIIAPKGEYRYTGLNSSGVPATDPIQDEELHSLSLSGIIMSMREGSPWIYGGWGRAELASDFQHIDGDDFTFDLAGGVGYRFENGFTLSAGAAAINLNGDAKFYPGIGFDWVVSDRFRAGLYGPALFAEYTPTENWVFSMRGDPGGGVWNITDDAGQSRSIDFSSYRIGLFASRRLVNRVWLTGGGGVALGNELEYTTARGTKLFSREAETGFFGSVGLRFLTW
jgi:hypothetical protein